MPFCTDYPLTGIKVRTETLSQDIQENWIGENPCHVLRFCNAEERPYLNSMVVDTHKRIGRLDPVIHKARVADYEHNTSRYH